jgi:hypothetical protein
VQLLLAGLALAAPVVLGIVDTPEASQGHEVFRFGDPAIVEGSALVVQDGLFLTTNDSGDTGRVFAVDTSGRTVGVTHWSDDPVDTEALAPGGPGQVWVGDLGDNTQARASVTIARVPIGRGNRTVTPTTYRLTYPDGPADAETLLRDPATGRLYLATKSVFGGVMYAVPQHLTPSGTNRLEAVGRVLPVATDGAFFPDGKHLIVRSYGSAVVYAWPSLQPVGSVGLPHERQGEGIAVADDGSVYLSSEGARSPVLRVELPARIAAIAEGVATTSPATASPRPDGSPGSADAATDSTESAGGSRDAWPWLAGGLLGVAAIGVLQQALRPR